MPRETSTLDFDYLYIPYDVLIVRFETTHIDHRFFFSVKRVATPKNHAVDIVRHIVRDRIDHELFNLRIYYSYVSHFYIKPKSPGIDVASHSEHGDRTQRAECDRDPDRYQRRSEGFENIYRFRINSSHCPNDRHEASPVPNW